MDLISKTHVGSSEKTQSQWSRALLHAYVCTVLYSPGRTLKATYRRGKDEGPIGS